MYIKRIVLENLKGFQRFDFPLTRSDGSHAGWTVVTGDNASGKTALLKAIALAVVGPDIARALQPSLRGWVKGSCARAEIAVQIVPHEVDKFIAGRRPETSFWSELELHDSGGPEVALKAGNRFRGNKKGPINGPWAENSSGWFAAGYGPFRRLYGTSTEAQRLMSGEGRIARFATLFKEDATLSEAESWLKDLNYKKLEDKEQESLVLEKTLKLLNDDFLRNGIGVDRVDSDGLWLKDAAGTILNLSDMSEGYRAALAMMIDVIRQLWIVYGHQLALGEESGRLAVQHEGVVLIDEADAHLHPEWQRQIGFWLKERFPKIQFIVTTHSPLICQAADPGGIFHLPPPASGEAPFRLREDDYWTVVRSKADAVLLSPAFGLTHTRSPQAVEALEKYTRLKAKKRSIGLTDKEHQLELSLERFVEPAELE